jgi:hypothetical protein
MNFDDTPPPREGFFVSCDRKLLDHAWIVRTILAEPWGNWRSHDAMTTAIANSVCWGLYARDEKSDSQIGFCRVVTDDAVFSWLADVVIDPKFRRQRLGLFMVGEVIRTVKGACYLATREHFDFYSIVGFERLGDSNVMRRLPQ